MKYIAVCCSLAFLLGCGARDTEPQAKEQTTAAESEATEEPARVPTAGQSELPKPLRVKMTTSMGVIHIELNQEKAPVTVENFLTYVRSGFYNGTIFHRVIPNFMIQGGGFTADMQQKPTRGPIKNEGANGLKNLRGTIAMARLPQPDTATSQFFINHRDNAFLDYAGPGREGYAVFGKVVSGMDVVDKIAAVPTHQVGPYGDVPVTPVIIESVEIINP